MISQLFILSPRGDVIINKQFRLDVPVKITTEVFFRTVKFWKDGDKAPAVFNEDGVNYVHVKVAGLFVAATTRKNVSPSLVLELLHRVAKVIKDYCGVLSEDALKNPYFLGVAPPTEDLPTSSVACIGSLNTRCLSVSVSVVCA